MCSLTVECVLLGVQDARLEEHGQRELRRGVCVCVRIECVFSYYRIQMTWFVFGREPISHV
jgi:hypothetical protein